MVKMEVDDKVVKERQEEDGQWRYKVKMKDEYGSSY